MSTVRDRVVAVVAEKLNVNPNDIEDHHSFIDDLGADSLDTVEVVMSLEEEFDVEIPDEEAEKITTIQEAVDSLEAKT